MHPWGVGLQGWGREGWTKTWKAEKLRASRVCNAMGVEKERTAGAACRAPVGREDLEVWTLAHLETNVLDSTGSSASRPRMAMFVIRYVFLGSSAISSSQGGSLRKGFLASTRRSSPAAGVRVGDRWVAAGERELDCTGSAALCVCARRVERAKLTSGRGVPCEQCCKLR